MAILWQIIRGLLFLIVLVGEGFVGLMFLVLLLGPVIEDFNDSRTSVKRNKVESHGPINPYAKKSVNPVVERRIEKPNLLALAGGVAILISFLFIVIMAIKGCLR